MWWNSSNQTCFIVNVDGSCLGNSIRVGFEGLLRHQIGRRISSFLDYITGIFDILHYKNVAISQGTMP